MKLFLNSSTPSCPKEPQNLFKISGIRGTVVHHSVIWKSTVTSGGGGGYLERGTGYIAPVWTRTDHTHRQEFWIRSSDGYEAKYWLERFENVHLREGHELGVLLLNGTVSCLMNHSTGTLYTIAPLDRLLPLRSVMSGCAITAFVLFAAPIIGFLLMLAISCCIGAVVRITVGIVPESQAPQWLNTVTAWMMGICMVGSMVASTVYLTRQSRRASNENEILRARGREELDAACKQCLGIRPAE